MAADRDENQSTASEERPVRNGTKSDLNGTNDQQSGDDTLKSATTNGDNSADDEWLDILENGELKKKVIVAGDKTQGRPERATKVTISLKTKIKDGEPVASETFEKRIGFVGDYDFLHGVDLAVPLMNVGEVATVIIAPRFGYGDVGKEPDIPAGATLECELSLHDCQWIEIESDLSLEEKINYGSAKKDRGNFWYKRDDASTAIHCYRRAVEFLDASEPEMQLLHAEGIEVDQLTDEQKVRLEEEKDKIRKLIELRATSYNNLAAAQMKTGATDQALKSLDSVLQLDANNVKALYRKGKILRDKGDTEVAIAVMKKALELDPSAHVVAQELRNLRSKKADELNAEKRLYKKMLEQLPEQQQARTKERKRQQWRKWALIGAILIAILAAFLGYQLLATESSFVQNAWPSD